jgi:DNA invertase Pin-like site-specific DNA recombinase
LGEALALVESGAADVICVSKLDRLSRSVVDFAGLVARAHASGWSLRALDVDLDMTTPVGGLIANILASVAEWERKVIAARTKAALQAAAARGQKLGRPRRMSAEAIARIGELHLAGHRPLEIARRLNEERIPTPTGSGVWHSHGVERGLRWARSTPAE